MATERRALVLAAGLGTRLRPLTDRTPKPLLPLGGESLLARIAGKLRRAGVTRLAVNAHHRAEQVAAAARDLPGFDEIAVFPEPEILGTGGALWGARGFLGEGEAFLLHNGDVECDADLAALWAAHADSGAEATLLLTSWPEVDSVVLGDDGRVRDLAARLAPAPAEGDRRLTYTGVAVFARRFLERLPAGASSLVDALIAALRDDPGAVRGAAPEGLAWSDLGTPGRYLDALLRVNHPDDAEAMADAVAALPLVREAGLADAVPERLAPAGSDRGFWRLDGRVLVKGRPDDPDAPRFPVIARFLHDEGLGAPEVFAEDPADAAVLVEDLGDDTLHRLAHAEPERRPEIYRLALDTLAALQTCGTAALPRCLPLAERRYDAATVRWEHDYFRTHFLRDEAGLRESDLAGLDADLALIGDAVLAQPFVLMHRDFQSQNILIRDGRARLVDLQGARRGPWAYDAASLLWDAYVDLGDGPRAELTAYYLDALAAAGGPVPADPARDLTAAGLQRVMQALGAFGFLAGVKGKVGYREHVPVALRYLRALLEAWRKRAGERALGRLEGVVARVGE